MKKFSKLKAFFRSPAKKNPAQEFVLHCNGEVFEQNARFQMLKNRITDFSPKGKFKVHQNGQEVFAKTGEMAFGEEEVEIASFVFGEENSTASRYIELRHGGQLVGIGNVWHRSGKAKTIFLYENKCATGFAKDVVSVIKIASGGQIDVAFYDATDDCCLGNTTIVFDKQQEKNIYDFQISPKLLGREDDDKMLVAKNCVGKETVCHPITFAQKLYSQTPQIFKVVDGLTKPHNQQEIER